MPWANRWHFALAQKQAFASYFHRKEADIATHTKDVGDWTPVSRAYYKLNEVLLRRTFVPTRDMTAIDVGAAPGGWTQRLAHSAGLVLAVDPGALEIPHIPYTQDMARPTEKGAVIHVAQRVQNAHAALAQFAPYYIYTCDMNVEFAVVLDLLNQMKPYLADGALTVVTVKMFRRLKHMLTLIRETQEQMRRAGFGSLQVLHLFANKKKEFTVIARKLSAAEQQLQDQRHLEYLAKQQQKQ